MVTAVHADVVRWLTFIAIGFSSQLLSALTVSGREAAAADDMDSHEHHSPTNVWTSARNREYVRYCS